MAPSRTACPFATNQLAEVEVDGLDLAAFMYFTLNNHNISRIIDGAGKKWVLLLGRFGRGKSLLRAVAEELKARHFVPIIFDFSRPQQRDLLETIVLLAGLSAFVIVEITNPRSAPMELLAVATNYGVPIVPIVQKRTRPFALFAAMRKFPWVLPPYEYATQRRLIADLNSEVIKPAMAESKRLAAWKRAIEPSSADS
jgi:hypothetical protein